MLGMRSESTEQTILVARLRQFHPDLLVMSIPNGGKRDPRVAAQMKREGVLPGAPDLLVAEPRDGQHGLFVEMKRQKGGRVSEDQKTVHDKLKARGYEVVVCEGADSAYVAVLRYAYGPSFGDAFPQTRAILARTGTVRSPSSQRGKAAGRGPKVLDSGSKVLDSGSKVLDSGPC